MSYPRKGDLSFSAQQVWEALGYLKPKLHYIRTQEYYDKYCYNLRSLPFDFGIKKLGRLYLVEFNDGNLPHPNALTKEEFCGKSNIPLIVLGEVDVWSGDLEDILEGFLNTKVIGKQNVNPCHSSEDFWFFQ